jgi:hypothetical protein
MQNLSCKNKMGKSNTNGSYIDSFTCIDIHMLFIFWIYYSMQNSGITLVRQKIPKKCIECNITTGSIYAIHHLQQLLKNLNRYACVCVFFFFKKINMTSPINDLSVEEWPLSFICKDKMDHDTE